jgi:hypothetical protein
VTPTLEALLRLGVVKSNPFPPESRYQNTPVATMTTPNGEVRPYLRRRFVPAPEKLRLLQEHTVLQGERLDLIAPQYFANPELFWRICDANGAIRPEELTEEPGTVLRIAMPEGL